MRISEELMFDRPHLTFRTEVESKLSVDGRARQGASMQKKCAGQWRGWDGEGATRRRSCGACCAISVGGGGGGGGAPNYSRPREAAGAARRIEKKA